MKNKMPPFYVIATLIVILVSISGVWADGQKLGNVSGKYTRETEDESATLDVNVLPDGKVHVRGISLWGTDRKSGPNIGELDFKASMKDGRVAYTERSGKKTTYRLELTLMKGGLSAKEEGHSGNFGMNVTFSGEYKKK